MYLYLILAEPPGTLGQWKIGITTRTPEKRLEDMKTSNPNLVGVLASYKTEQKYLYKIESVLKRYFKKWTIEGEWIKYDALTPKIFLEKCQKIESNFIYLDQNTTLSINYKNNI